MSHAVSKTGLEDGMERNTAPRAVTDGGCVAKGTSEDVLGGRPETAERATREKEDKVADGGPSYSRELSVAVELVGEEKIPMMEMLRAMQSVCGLVLGCRYLSLNKYEVTMNHPNGKRRLLDGFRIRGTSVVAKDLTSDEMVVSFMSLPVYITDEEILKKLADWGVEAVSPIARRKWPGMNICEGTRFVKVKFNKEVRSLPWSTRFDTEKGAEYFRVIHDRQLKVCRLCIQPGHIVRDCPDFLCRKCGKQGHYARECVAVIKCRECGNRRENCVCKEEQVGGGALSVDPDSRAVSLESEGSGGEESAEEEMEHGELSDGETVLDSQLRVVLKDPGVGGTGLPGGQSFQVELSSLPASGHPTPAEGVAKVLRGSGQLGDEEGHGTGASLEADLVVSMAPASGGDGGTGMGGGRSSQAGLLSLQAAVWPTVGGDAAGGSCAGTSEATADASYWRGMAPISSPPTLADGREGENKSVNEALVVCRERAPRVRRRRGVDSDEEQRNLKKKGVRKKKK